MLGSVDENNPFCVEDLVDDPKLASPCRAKALKLSPKRLAGAPGIIRDRAEYGS